MAQGPPLAQLSPGSQVSGTYLLNSVELGTTKNGQAFGKLILGDPSGQVPGRLWDRAEELLAPLEAGRAVKIRGRVDSFRGQAQVIVEHIEPTTAEPADFLPASPIAPEELWQQLGKALRQVHDRNLKQLLDLFFADQAFRNTFGRAPAAKAAHHAYVAGLLEHTASLATMAVAAADHYTHLDRDVLIAGALLHDIGKTQELTLGPPIDYTDQGRLMGHLVLGLDMLEKRLARLPKFPAATADHLRHLIVSHHGFEQFGSPTKPKTPEAVALHLLDDLDAKTAMVKEALAARPEGQDWTAFHRLLERHLFTPAAETGAPASTEPESEPTPEPTTPTLF